MTSTTAKEYKIEVLQPHQWEDVIPIVRDSFCPGEPLTQVAGGDHREVAEFLIPSIKACVGSGLSMVVRDAQHNIVGVRLSKSIIRDVVETVPEFTMKASPETLATLDVISHLENAVDILNLDPPVDKVLNLYLVTIDPKCRGKGLAADLIKENIRHAQQHGCKRAVVITTNQITQHIYKKIGYTTQYVLDYDTYEIDGKRVLDTSRTAGTTCAMIQTKDI